MVNTGKEFANTSKQVTAIVRSVGERTENACYKLLAQQVPEENIVIINEVPFSAAVAKTFQVGIERGLPWTLCIDADVLLKDGAVNDLLTIASQANENVFAIQSSILCKFFGGSREAGNHLYRTSLLNKALDCIPKTEVIRPESNTIKKMVSQGFSWLRKKELTIGLHDYEQYYVDIYRKAFVQAHKHDYLATTLFEPLWNKYKHQDPDYQVALWGLKAGQIYDGKVAIDIRQFPDQINELLQTQGWQEKTEMVLNSLSALEIAKIIDNFQPSSEYQEFDRWRKGGNQQTVKAKLKKILAKILGKKL